jgi:RNA polymerase sigma-70 factor, ECF subfamily
MKWEKEIIEQVRKGQVDQYRLLVEKYQKPVFRVILKIVCDEEDARELTQDVFVRSYESLYQYNPDYKYFSWIYRIAINQALLFVKRKKKFVPVETIGNQAESLTGTNEDGENKNKRITRSVNNLDSKYRSVILLKYYAGLSYPEIAVALNIPEKKVKSRLFDARKILRKELMKTNFFASVYAN